MTQKKNIVMVTMLAVVAVMSIAYAFFATNLNITSTGNISSSWDVKFINITNDTPVGSASNIITPSYTATTATMSTDLKLPGDSITYRITLRNNGDIPAIIEDIDASATGSGAIVFSLTGLNIGDKLAGGAEKEIVVKIEYDPNTTGQPAETTKTLTVSIKAVQDTGQSIESETPNVNQPMYLSSAIFRDNTAYADNVASPYVTASTGIDFSKTNDGCHTDKVTFNTVCGEDSSNGKGLYYTSTNTENNQVTYYFRGRVSNNYVKFGKDSSGNDIIWRIVRINEDGSIRLIAQKSVGSSVFNILDNDNAYVGYMYGTSGSDNYKDTHTNINDSAIKDVLDAWYENNLKTNYSSYLADAGFCNDRSVSPTSNTWTDYDTALGYGENYTMYGAYNRIRNNYQPQFKCPQTNDLFTTSSSAKGNKALTYSIGLLTIDEVVFAGAIYDSIPSSSYLGYGHEFWSMSPYATEIDGSLEWRIGSEGFIDLNGVDTKDNVRPVINLKSTVEITGGNGTGSSPYTIKTN